MKEIIRKLNKYLILLIFESFFGLTWWYLSYWLFPILGRETFIQMIPTTVTYSIKIIIIIFLIIDFKREKLKGVLLACLATFFYPVLGVVIFILFLIIKERPVYNNG